MESLYEREQCSVRHTFYKDEDFQIEYEVYEDILILHSEVFNWKLSSLKKGYRQFALLKEEASKLGFTKMATCTPNPNFAKLFGGKTQTILPNEVELIIWELKL